MKVIAVHTVRMILGLTFIILGLLKVNDPKGYSVSLLAKMEHFEQAFRPAGVILNFHVGENTHDSLWAKVELARNEVQGRIDFKAILTPNTFDTLGNVLSFNQRVSLYFNGRLLSYKINELFDTNYITTYSIKVVSPSGPLFQNTSTSIQLRNNNISAIIDLSQFQTEESPWLSRMAVLKDLALILGISFAVFQFLIGFSLVIGFRLKQIVKAIYTYAIITLFFLTWFWLSEMGISIAGISFLAMTSLTLIVFIYIYNINYFKWIGVTLSAICILLGVLWVATIDSDLMTSHFYPANSCFKYISWWNLNTLQEIILFVLVALFSLFLLFFSEIIKPWFSSKFGYGIIGFWFLNNATAAVLCLIFLPAFNYSSFSKGQRLANLNNGTFSMITSENQEKVDEYIKLGDKGYLLVVPKLEKANKTLLNKAVLRYKWAKESKIPFDIVSSSEIKIGLNTLQKYKMGDHYLQADWQLLETMAPCNPTLYFLKGDTIIKRWSGNWMPGKKQFTKARYK
jgi:hypothetical protein